MPAINVWRAGRKGIRRKFLGVVMALCVIVPSIQGYCVIDQDPPSTRYWHTKEHKRYHGQGIDADVLLPWLREYDSLPDSFSARNGLAFRFSDRYSGLWWFRLALVAADPELWELHRVSLVHLASARLGRPGEPADLSQVLSDRDPEVVKGALLLLPRLRKLRMDRRDAKWPTEGLVDPPMFAQRVALVLQQHPQHGVLVARALETYGPAAAPCARDLVPLLVSDDEHEVSAARKALIAVDPNGLAKSLGLKMDAPLDDDQRRRVDELVAKIKAEPPRTYKYPVHPRQFGELERLFHGLKGASSDKENEVISKFFEKGSPAEWWPVAITVRDEWELLCWPSPLAISNSIAGALYLKEGSPGVVERLLKSDDISIAARAVQTIAHNSFPVSGRIEDPDSNNIAPDRMPALFAQVLELHPGLYIDVLNGLYAYDSAAKNQSGVVGPYLLSADPYVVYQARLTLTRINPDLAELLECTIEEDDADEIDTEYDELPVLTERQRGLVEAWLKNPSSIPAREKQEPAKKTSEPDASGVKTMTNSIGMDLILIQPGQFRMGSPRFETGRRKDEGQVDVTLTKAFYLGKTEVTQKQWRAVMGTTPWKGEYGVREGDNDPATYVSWDDAQAFCKKLSQTDRGTYRLPTEAEWEYACRGGTTTRFSFGDKVSNLGEYAWFSRNAEERDEDFAHAVATKKPNPFGLFDMHGNVFEWCEDIKVDKLPGGADPLVTGADSDRVIRGGSWDNRAAVCRSAVRWGIEPDYPDYFIGFRVALSPAR